MVAAGWRSTRLNLVREGSLCYLGLFRGARFDLSQSEGLSLNVAAPFPGVAHEHPSKSQQEGHAVRTYSPKPADITRQWHVIDAEDVVLGRLAVEAATLLRGKHKATYAPHMDGGDFVVIINAEKVALSGNKRTDKNVFRHSGYPGGLKQIAYGDLLEKDARKAVEKSVRGMLPKNRLGRQLITKLKVYAGPDHPHAAQKPQPFEITQISQ